ncbi:MAG: ATPase [Candidatus Nanohalarchaeota archaeon]|nr:MAG: ATPase [Candidatus Nanohaloarchaeota archaeon]
MRKEEILEILADTNFWIKKQDVGIKRSKIINEIEIAAESKEIIILSGIRRCGKSTIARQYIKKIIDKKTDPKKTLIVNFEDPRLRNLSLDLMNEIYAVYCTEISEEGGNYIILDEIQNINGWEKFARYLYEIKKENVFITGSSSKLLSGEYSTVLAGRHLGFNIFPLSFREFLIFNGFETLDKLQIIGQKNRIKKLFSIYLENGGFPKIVLTSLDQNKKDIAKSYFDSIIIKDIINRHNISEKQILKELAKYYLSSISSLQSFNKLKGVFNVSLDTIQRFSYYLEEVYLLYFVKMFDYSVKKQILNPKKVYCIDTGLRNALCFKFRENLGQLYENIVFIELKRRGKEIYYWKDLKQKECDFVIKEGLKITTAIQVTYNIENPDTKKREINSLMAAMKEFDLSSGLIITEDFEDRQTIDGKTIRFIPLWKWLINR